MPAWPHLAGVLVARARAQHGVVGEQRLGGVRQLAHLQRHGGHRHGVQVRGQRLGASASLHQRSNKPTASAEHSASSRH